MHYVCGLCVRLSVRPSVVCISRDAMSLYTHARLVEGFTWNLLQIVHHMSGNCWHGFKGQRSKVKVICVQMCECSNGGGIYFDGVTSRLMHLFQKLCTGFCHTRPISLCVDLFVFICVYFVCFCFILHSCIIVSVVGWTGWDWSLILGTSSFNTLTLLVGSFDSYILSPICPIMCLVGRLNLALSLSIKIIVSK